jgi:hypothetical protein
LHCLDARWRSSIILVLAGCMAALACHASQARACGPSFPPSLLLGDRRATLEFLPDGSFAREVAGLVPRPAEHFVAVEDGVPLKESPAADAAAEYDRYRRGASAFRAGNLDEARQAFLSVLALPATERRHLGPVAAFMLGRIGPDWARWFGEVRRLVASGDADPLGLAVASYGEEARRLLDPAAFAQATDAVPGAQAGATPPDDLGAIRRYATQAAYGSASAAQSLRIVAEGLVGHPERLETIVEDPLVQRLMTTWAWTRGMNPRWSPKPSPAVVGLLERLSKIPAIVGADRLAAGAWRAGRFDLAAQFAGKEQTALALWVQAKLAARGGDLAQADRLLAEAWKRFPDGERWEGEEFLRSLAPRARISGERCVLAMARDDFESAFDQARASGSWIDMAYVAERGLTSDELARGLGRPLPPVGESEGIFYRGPRDPASGLRYLLGRRLLREGRGEQALASLPAALEPHARSYLAAARQTREATGVDRARALWQLAALERRYGLELLGFELAPDWRWLGGNFDARDEYRWSELASVQPPLLGKEEVRRVAAHGLGGPARPSRLHYRLLAADHAEQAALLVPPRTQAYAALLCHAAAFTAAYEEYGDRQRQRLWQTYVEKGIPVPFAPTFGYECPDPDFEHLVDRQGR